MELFDRLQQLIEEQRPDQALELWRIHAEQNRELATYQIREYQDRIHQLRNQTEALRTDLAGQYKSISRRRKATGHYLGTLNSTES